jgi:hypothetical protein
MHRLAIDDIDQIIVLKYVVDYWTQGNAVLSDLNEASPNKTNKGEKTEGLSVVLEISSTVKRN